MLQADWQTAADLNLFTDASGTLGFGAYFKGVRIMGTWSKEQLGCQVGEHQHCYAHRSTHLLKQGLHNYVAYVFS